MTVPKERIPYVDRPEARPYCTCAWAKWTDDEAGHQELRIDTNPECVLHGTNAQPSPF